MLITFNSDHHGKCVNYLTQDSLFQTRDLNPIGGLKHLKPDAVGDTFERFDSKQQCRMFYVLYGTD